MAEMTDWDKRKMKELEDFQAMFKSLAETMDVVIGFIWAFVAFGFPLLIYFKPLTIEGVSGAFVAFIVFGTLALISIVWRKIGRATKY